MFKLDHLSVYELVYLHPISAYEFQRQACPLAPFSRDVSGQLLQHFESCLGMLSYSVGSLKSSQDAINTRRLDNTPFVKPRFGHVFFFYCPFSNFNWSNNGFGKRLGIFLLYQRLYPRPIDIFRRRVVLFVFMKDDSPMRRLFRQG